MYLHGIVSFACITSFKWTTDNSLPVRYVVYIGSLVKLRTEGQSLVSTCVRDSTGMISGVVMCGRYRIEGNHSGLCELVL